MSNHNFSTTALLKLVLDIEEKYPNCHKDKYFDLNQLENIINDAQALNSKQCHILYLKYEQNELNFEIWTKWIKSRYYKKINYRY